MENKEKKVKIIDSSAYCIKCGEFLGMICDPFAKGKCDKCFPNQDK